MKKYVLDLYKNETIAKFSVTKINLDRKNNEGDFFL
jgi:hypothetical protein